MVLWGGPRFGMPSLYGFSVDLLTLRFPNAAVEQSFRQYMLFTAVRNDVHLFAAVIAVVVSAAALVRMMMTAAPLVLLVLTLAAGSTAALLAYQLVINGLYHARDVGHEAHQRRVLGECVLGEGRGVGQRLCVDRSRCRCSCRCVTAQWYCPWYG